MNGGSAAIDCGNVGAAFVRITAIEVDAAFGSVVGFDCDTLSGTSQGRGTYRLALDLRSRAGDSLLDAPIRLNDVIIEGGGDTVVEPQAFTVIPQGSLSFTTIAANASGGNCAAVGDMGAGIVGMRFNLRDLNGVCVNSTFTIAAGGQPGGTYTSDCTNTPAAFTCIEADQIVSIDPAPSGDRDLEIIGLIAGDLPCRRAVSQFAIPGNNLAISLDPRTLALDTTPPDCEEL